MTKDDGLRTLLVRYLKSHGDPPNKYKAAPSERLRHRMRERTVRLVSAKQTESVDTHRLRWVPAMAAAALLVAVIGTAIVWPRGARVYAAGNDGLQVTLADDSRVEMRAYSEMTVGHASDGIEIDLKTGDIIVTAAKPRDGHLYVRTKGMTVALPTVARDAKAVGGGAVFLVNAGRDGSRVAVIEGEVRVREGDVETRLRPGEETATSPTIAWRPLTDAITWSRNAEMHLAILHSFQRGIAQTSGPLSPVVPSRELDRRRDAGAAGPAAVEFEEASVRECDPDNLPRLPTGARGGGANSFYMTPGRTYALCVTVATLVRTAYGYEMAGPVNRAGGRSRPMRLDTVYGVGVENGLTVRGGPDWVRNERYTIEAVAADGSNAEVMQGPMMRALLERRFRLKVHIETEPLPGYELRIANSGLRLKPVDASCVTSDGSIDIRAKCNACELPFSIPADGSAPVPTGIRRTAADVRRGEKPQCGLNESSAGPNQVVVAGGLPLKRLERLASIVLRVPVEDKTGNTDRFNFVLEFAREQPLPGAPGAVSPTPDAAKDISRGPTLFRALEELGLKLEPIQVPREFVVIDQVERPSPN